MNDREQKLTLQLISTQTVLRILEEEMRKNDFPATVNVIEAEVEAIRKTLEGKTTQEKILDYNQGLMDKMFDLGAGR